MPRISRSAPPEVEAAIRVIEAFCQETKTNINSLANCAGVKQSALWRFVKGERKSVTDVAEQTLRHIDSWHNRHNQAEASKISLRQGKGDGQGDLAVIEEAIRGHWNGSRLSADLLIAIIRAVAPLLHLASDHKKNSEISPR